jgi:alanine dehydrogenase
MAADPHLAQGLNIAKGTIRHGAVAEALALPYAA